MGLTNVLFSEFMHKHADRENGLHDLLEIMLESMMVAERGEFLLANPTNKGNGYRPGHCRWRLAPQQSPFPRPATPQNYAFLSTVSNE